MIAPMPVKQPWKIQVDQYIEPINIVYNYHNKLEQTVCTFYGIYYIANIRDSMGQSVDLRYNLLLPPDNLTLLVRKYTVTGSDK